MFTENRNVRTILWGQGQSSLTGEQLIPANTGVKVQVVKPNSRQSLFELSNYMRPDLVIFETSIPGEQGWLSVIHNAKLRQPEVGMIAIVNDLTNNLLRDLAVAQVDSILKLDKVHLELPSGLRAYQKGETFLNTQVAKVICSLIHMQTSLTAHQERGLLGTLTNREMEMLACLVQGMNYKTIAKTLFVSDSTVKTHVNNIFTKLNVNDRTQAVLYGLKHGIDQMVPEIFRRMEANQKPEEILSF
ncbi:MAG: response regulator transcription factor [Candidatus Caenarcaniphilales bacterium]|nr:response regulator transcription factor [Candidatus Caenarcaniphilales bacterium]